GVWAGWAGARVVYGPAEPRESAASLFYDRNPIARGRHVVEQNLSVAEAVAGRHLEPRPVDFPRDPESEERMAARLSARRISQLVILNPGAGWGAKRWPVERYGQLARSLADDGLSPIFNYGPGEKDLARAAASASGGAAEAIPCSLSELIALTRRARLFIGGDTGPMHLAAARGIPG